MKEENIVNTEGTVECKRNFKLTAIKKRVAWPIHNETRFNLHLINHDFLPSIQVLDSVKFPLLSLKHKCASYFYRDTTAIENNKISVEQICSTEIYSYLMKQDNVVN